MNSNMRLNMVSYHTSLFIFCNWGGTYSSFYWLVRRCTHNGLFTYLFQKQPLDLTTSIFGSWGTPHHESLNMLTSLCPPSPSLNPLSHSSNVWHVHHGWELSQAKHNGKHQCINFFWKPLEPRDSKIFLSCDISFLNPTHSLTKTQ